MIACLARSRFRIVLPNARASTLILVRPLVRRVLPLHRQIDVAIELAANGRRGTDKNGVIHVVRPKQLANRIRKNGANIGHQCGDMIAQPVS